MLGSSARRARHRPVGPRNYRVARRFCEVDVYFGPPRVEQGGDRHVELGAALHRCHECRIALLLQSTSTRVEYKNSTAQHSTAHHRHDACVASMIRAVLMN